MKNIHLFTALLMFLSGLISCQTIADLQTAYSSNTPNIYYKDIGNKFNPYEGTWVYDDGTSYMKIALIKKIKATVWNHYEDYLIGAFQYKKNGIDIINNLNTLNNNLSDPTEYLIWGNTLLFSDAPSPFEAYTSNLTRLKTSIIENGCISHISVRTLSLNGQSAIQISKEKPFEQPQDCNPVIPNGFYYLIKQ
jgi:hypothetical protein